MRENYKQFILDEIDNNECWTFDGIVDGLHRMYGKVNIEMVKEIMEYDLALEVE